MKGRYVLGIALVLLGIIFFLDQIGLWSFGYIISTWWPLIIIAVGVSHLLSNNKSLFGGLAILAVGLLLQANELGMLPGGFWGAFWPMILVLIGLSILLSKRHGFRHWHKNLQISNDLINVYTIFSGNKQKIESSNFQGGEVSTMFGGAQIDLRNTILSPDGATLDLSCAFGGIEIKVPYHWRIVTVGTPILGALENKTVQEIKQDNLNSPILRINYFVIFGGIEIKN